MHTIGTPGLWSVFGLLVVVALIIDFVVLRAGGAHKVSYKEAALWSVAWIVLAMLFNLGLWYWLNGQAGRKWPTRRRCSSSPATWSRRRWRSTTSSSSC